LSLWRKTSGKFSLTPQELGGVVKCSGGSDYYLNKKTLENLDDTYEDVVDRVNRLYSAPNINYNKSIKDVYDELTKKILPEPQKCIINPYIDETSGNPMYFTESCKAGKTIKKDMWAYNDEKIMNGGHIGNNLYPNDIADTNEATVF